MTPLQTRSRLAIAAVALSFVVASCDDAGAPEGAVALSLSRQQINLNGVTPETLAVHNTGAVVAGPIEIDVEEFTTEAGAAAFGLTLEVEPSAIPTLDPGDSQLVTVRMVDISPSVPDGSYLTRLRVSVADSLAALLDVEFRLANCLRDPFRVSSLSGPTDIVQGAVTQFSAQVLDSTGAAAAGACVAWSVSPPSAGIVTSDGRFVGYEPGVVTIVAASGLGSDSITAAVSARGLSGSFATTGVGQITDRFSSDLWVYGTAAYLGTWSSRNGQAGNTVYVWDIGMPAAPALADSLALDAQTVNDVKISSDGTLAVVTHEASSDGLNGITLLDLADPLHPTTITRFTQSLETGVHNVWIDGSHVYVAVDGANASGGLRVLDITDPNNPSIAGSFYAGSSFLHDVYVRDGLAFLSHWNAGLVILDVGNGIRGGTPAAPVEVSRLAVSGGQTHNAWYWPAAGYAFVGEEDFASPGVAHVVDVRDLSNPQEVATFSVPGTTPHNFWLDEASGVLFLAWYSNGIAALDVSGDLLGELDKQGREITVWQYGGSGACPASVGTSTCTWAPQLHQGKIYLSDINTGLWVLDRVGF